MTTQVITPEFRVSYPKVFKPERNTLNDQDEYSLVALFAAGADLTAVKAAVKEAAEKKWGADPKKWPKNMRSPFKVQEMKQDDDGNDYLPSGFTEGASMLSVKSQKKPGLVDASNQDIIDDNDFYGGCYARAQVNAFAYDKKGNVGVALGLNHVQKLRDGESFGSATRNASDVFSPVSETGGSSAGGMFD